MKKMHMKDWILAGIMAAVVYVATNINIPTPGPGGLIHLGNAALYLTLFAFGTRVAIFAAPLGMSLFDLFSPYVAWAPFTLVIRIVQVFVAGLIFDRLGKNSWAGILSTLISGLVMIFGYFLAHLAIYGLQSYALALTGLPGDLTQVLSSLVLSVPLGLQLRKRLESVSS